MTQLRLILEPWQRVIMALPVRERIPALIRRIKMTEVPTYRMKPEIRKAVLEDFASAHPDVHNRIRGWHALATYSLWYGPVPLSEQRVEDETYPGDLDVVSAITEAFEETGYPRTVYYSTMDGFVVLDPKCEHVDCHRCDGTGEVGEPDDEQRMCPACLGDGTLEEDPFEYLIEVDVLDCLMCQQVRANL